MREWESWVGPAQAGDLDAFSALVRHFQDMAVGYAYSVLGDFDQAEDAAQEAFIRAYRDLAKLEKPRAFPAWFRRVVYSQCNRLVRGKRLPMMPLDGVPEMAAPTPSPAEMAQRRELQDHVLQAIQALPENQREVTSLFYINGYSLAEVGEFLDVPVTTVKNRLHSARNQLRERMTDMVEKKLKDNAPGPEFSEEVRMQVPKPRDHYDLSQLPEELDAFLKDLVLSVCPKGSSISEVESVHPLYVYPLLIRVETPTAGKLELEIKANRGPRVVEVASKLFPVLNRLGLPVQEVLTEPTIHPDHPEAGPVLVTTHLPGHFLKLINTSAIELDFTCRIILEGIERLEELTDTLRAEPVSKELPEVSLIEELEQVIERRGPWFGEKPYVDTVERLMPVLKTIETPHVLAATPSSSWNFVTDGEKITGFFWMENSRFQDPFAGFAKNKVWEGDCGWAPFTRCGLVEKYLYSKNATRSEFAPRLVLRMLADMQNNVPVVSKKRPEQREKMLRRLQEWVSWME